MFKDGAGVIRFKNGRFTVYGSDVGLPITSYIQLVRDRVGSIWAATSSGLFRFRKGLIATYSTDDKLAHNEVYPLLKGRNGDIWIGTVHGLSLLRNGGVVKHPLNGFMELVQSLWEDRAGRLWIGTWDSLPIGHPHRGPSGVKAFPTGAITTCA